MKKIIYYLLVIVAACGIASCTSDDDGKIKLAKGQLSDMSFFANQTTGEINFTAEASWSAWASSTPTGYDDVDWITLNLERGQAGKVSLTFSLDYNNTGSSRSAYIIIICEDVQIAIKITQTTEEDDDDYDEPSQIDPRYYFAVVLNKLGMYRILDFDGNLFSYENYGNYGNDECELVSMISGNDGRITLKYGYNTLTAEDTYGRRWVITMGGDHFAKHIEFYDGNEKTTYDLEYSGNHLTKFTQSKNGKVYETTELIWSFGDVTWVRTTFSGGSTELMLKYSDVDNVCNLMMYDTQLWVDMDDMEIFYFLGIFGNGTKHLIASSTATEIDDGEKYTFSSKYDYSFDSKNRPTKIVCTEVEDGRKGYSSVVDLSWKDAPLPY